MKALDRLLVAASIAVIAIFLLPVVFDVYPIASPPIQFWLRNIAGVFVMSFGVMLMGLTVFSILSWTTVWRLLGLWPLFLLCAANALRFSAPATAILAGLQAGNWFDLPPDLTLAPEPLRSAVAAIFLCIVAHNIYWLAEIPALRKLRHQAPAGMPPLPQSPAKPL